MKKLTEYRRSVCESQTNFGPAKSSWCGEHRPAHTGRCANHEEQILHEMHDDSLRSRFKISAIFYCPVFACTFYDYNYDYENDLVADVDESKWEDAVVLRVLIHKLALREGDEK